MKISFPTTYFTLRRAYRARSAAFTLAEVVVCIFIVGVLFGGMITAYNQTSYRAEWSGYALAAQSLACQQIEQAKSAVWDSTHDEIANLSTKTAATLDLPVSGSNVIWATNYATVNKITIAAGVYVYMVRVDTVWPFRWSTSTKYFTNTVADYFAQD